MLPSPLPNTLFIRGGLKPEIIESAIDHGTLVIITAKPIVPKEILGVLWDASVYLSSEIDGKINHRRVMIPIDSIERLNYTPSILIVADCESVWVILYRKMPKELRWNPWNIL